MLCHLLLQFHPHDSDTQMGAVLQCSEALLDFPKMEKLTLNNVGQVSAMFETVGPPWHMEKRRFDEDFEEATDS